MASPKRELFTRDEIRLADFTRALSHPARVAIISRLAQAEYLYFSEITKEIPLADSTVSQHLAELKKAGLIEDLYDPPRVKYSINRENWKTARKYLKEFTKIKFGQNEKKE
jgi:ArsR family transcriptional regulator